MPKGEPIRLLTDHEEAMVSQRQMSARVMATVPDLVAQLEMIDRRIKLEGPDLEPGKLRNMTLARARTSEEIALTLDLAERLRPPDRERVEHPDFASYPEPEPPDGETSTG